MLDDSCWHYALKLLGEITWNKLDYIINTFSFSFMLAFDRCCELNALPRIGLQNIYRKIRLLYLTRRRKRVQMKSQSNTVNVYRIEVCVLCTRCCVHFSMRFSVASFCPSSLCRWIAFNQQIYRTRTRNENGNKPLNWQPRMKRANRRQQIHPHAHTINVTFHIYKFTHKRTNKNVIVARN